jgi:hypothetical protein
MTPTTTDPEPHTLVYDLETGIGWALGAVLVAFARPVVWCMFHDWNDQHPRKTLAKLRDRWGRR